jgi:hypothetical protein
MKTIDLLWKILKRQQLNILMAYERDPIIKLETDTNGQHYNMSLCSGEPQSAVATQHNTTQHNTTQHNTT